MSLAGCIANLKGQFSESEAKDLTKAVVQAAINNPGKKTRIELEQDVVKAALDQAFEDKKMVEDLVREAMGLPEVVDKPAAKKAKPEADKQTKETDKGTAQFSRTQSDAWNILASNMDAFQNPTPGSFDMSEAAQEIDPGMRADEEAPDADEARDAKVSRKWIVKMPDGTLAKVYENESNEVWINAANLNEGVSGGTKLYLLVGSYAEGNGKVFIGDPAGLSDVALLRRTENMLSLALRFGRTDFLMPHEYQMNPDEKLDTVLKDVARPINWVVGDNENNLGEMLKTSYANTVNLFPEIKNVTYNFDKQRFEQDGQAFTDFDGLRRRGIGALRQRGLSKIIATRDPRTGRGEAEDYTPVGSATLKRTALTNTFSREARAGTGRALLDKLSAVVSGKLTGTGLEGVLYSRGSVIEATTESTAFKKWFGDSQVVDANGKPKIVYHGTDSQFTKVNFKKGAQGLFWFTSDRESIERGEAGAQGTSKVMELYASIKNPAGWKEYDKYSVDELEGRGYDGVILPEKDGSFVGFIFKESAQVKSATDNNNDFDASNPDIRFSRQQRAATEASYPTNEANREKTDRLAQRINLSTGDRFTITPVSLPDDANDGDGKRGDNAGTARRDGFELADQIAGILNKEIIHIKADGPFQMNGVVVPSGSLSKYVFLDVRSEHPAHVTLGHELTHHMEADTPKIYQDLKEALIPLLKDTAGYSARAKLAKGTKLDMIHKEMIGDLMGDRFDEPAFWQQVAANTTDPVFKKIAMSIRMWLTKIIARLKGKGLGSEQFVTDLEAARSMLAKAAANYADTRLQGEAINREGVATYSAKPNAPTFYSQLARAFESMPAKVDDTKASNIKLWLLSNKSKLGVKDEEIQLSGILDYLDLKGEISKAHITEYLENGGVQVEEVVLSEGETFTTSDSAIRYIADQKNMTPKEVREAYDYSNERDFISLANSLAEQEDYAPGEAKTKFSQWQLPGGENYKELFLTLPKIAGYSWRDGHAGYEGIENPIVRIRLNSRIDVDGNKVLFIEELQKPQKGQEKDMPPALAKDPKIWVSMAIKRMIRYAAENGFDKISWTTGQQQSDRYDLSTQIKAIQYFKGKDGRYELRVDSIDGQMILDESDITASRVEKVVGKDMLKKMDAGEGRKFRGYWKELSGLDLKVGGEGMAAFYDAIVPQAANDILKKLGGGKVENIIMERGHEMEHPESGEIVETQSETQPGFYITPAMREKATREGLPMFSRAQRQSQLPGTPTTPNQPSLGLSNGSSGHSASWDAPAPSTMDDVTYRLQNKFVDLKQVQEAITKTSGALRDSINAYQKEELFHKRAATRAEEFLETELNPLLDEMRKLDVTQEDIGKFVWAKHAKEANAHIATINPALPDGGSGMTNQEADDYFAALPAAKRSNYESLAQRVYDITRKTRETLVDYGLMSANDKTTWEDAYQFYVPLNREDMDGLSHGNGSGQGFSIRGSESQRRTGSTLNVVDILGNIANQRDRAIVRGEKNRVALALYGLAKLNPNPDFWKTDAPPKIKVVERVGGVDTVVSRVDPGYKSLDNVVMVKIPDGRGNVIEHSIVFNKRDERAMRLSGAIKNLDGTQLGEFLGTAAKITRYFAAINTQYNPIFGVINLTRDVQGALLNLTNTPLAGKQARILADTFVILANVVKNKGRAFSGPWKVVYDEFIGVGGATGYRDMFSTGQERSEAIQKALDPAWWTNTAWGKIITANGYLDRPAMLLADKGVRPIFSWLSDYNTVMENSVRLAAYAEAKKIGLTKDQAASVAKNLTVNFNRKGEMALQVGSLYAFFNASIQGMTRMVATLKGPAGKRIIFGGIALGAMQAAAGFDDDEPPEFVRERNLIFPIGGKRYLMLPMPLGFNVLPNIGRISTELLLSGGKDPGKKISNMLGIVADAFNPLGGSAPLSQIVSPTVTDPLVALATNTDWTGKNIAREDFNSLNPTPGFTRSKDTASAASKWVAETINTLSGGTKYKPGIASPTPDQIEYLIGQVTGGVGREVGKTVTTAESFATGEDLPSHKVPLLGRFYGNSEGQAAQGNAFYSNIKEINEHESTVKGLRKDHKGREAAEYIRDNPDAMLIGIANKTEQRVQELRRSKRELTERGASKESIKMIELRITNEMKRFNERVEMLKKRQDKAA